jgi:hypothetical protein
VVVTIEYNAEAVILRHRKGEGDQLKKGEDEGNQ